MAALSFSARLVRAALFLMTGLASLSQFALHGQAPTKSAAPGLLVSFAPAANEKPSDMAATAGVCLFVPAAEAASPFLPEGKFVATWTGSISVELRGDYLFAADLRGDLKLEINGEAVLTASESGSMTKPGKEIKLNKGANALRATFTGPPQGDAYVRLHWKPKDSFLQPVPSAAFTHADSAEWQSFQKLHAGRNLFVEFRCAKCHTAAGTVAGKAMPELEMDAPAFEGIGSRRNAAWLAQWIADPKAVRPSARMPQLFHGNESRAHAESIAAFLASLKEEKEPAPKTLNPDQSPAGKKLFETLHCAACHLIPDSGESDPKRISLKQVAAKFPGAALLEFLKQPDAHYQWIRMPRFKLSDEQREQIGSYVLANAEKAGAPGAAPVKTELIEQGKKLVQSSGCLNCHSAKVENQFTTKPVAQLNWKAGCLADEFPAEARAPRYSFASTDREALRAFAESGFGALRRHVPADFAARQKENLNCLNCHGQVEGVPPLELLGEKLAPEWAARFIAGEISYKPRPWLEAQMPAFPKRAELLAEGMAQEHGLSPKSETEPALDADAAKIGQKLVSAPPHGFSCVSCHSAGTFAATEVFEAPGINFAYSAGRLRPAFARRWIRSPTLIDPQSKMPVYFDEEGKSPLADIYEGNGEKQIQAIWQYIRLGDKMPAPKSPDAP